MNLNPFDQLNPVTIGATVVIFSGTYVIMRKTVFAPLVSVMEDREERLRRGAAAAEEARTRLCEAEVKAEETRNMARIEADDILRRSRERAEKHREAVVAEAQAQAHRVLDDGRAKLAAARDAEIAALRAEALDCVGLACDKLLVPAERRTAEAIVDSIIAKRIH